MYNQRLPSGFRSSSGIDSFTADELEVAGVLSHLPGLIRQSESARRVPSSWGSKRRRSFLDSPEFLPVTAKLDYASNSPDSPLVFSSLADFDSKRAVPDKKPSSVTAEFKEAKAMELFTGDRLLAGNTKMQHTKQLCVSSNEVSLELRLFGKSEPLDRFHQQEAQIKMIPDLNAPAEVYAAELGFPLPMHHQLEYYSHHYQIAAAAKTRAEATAMARRRRHLIQKSKKAARGRR